MENSHRKSIDSVEEMGFTTNESKEDSDSHEISKEDSLSLIERIN